MPFLLSLLSLCSLHFPSLPSQGMARMCCDPRHNVRHMAISYLQRALLAHDLQRLSPNEWEACFLEVKDPTWEGRGYVGGWWGVYIWWWGVGDVGGWWCVWEGGIAEDCVTTLPNTAAVTSASSLPPLPHPFLSFLQGVLPHAESSAGRSGADGCPQLRRDTHEGLTAAQQGAYMYCTYALDEHIHTYAHQLTQ